MEISGKAELLALELVEFIEDKFNESGVELPVALADVCCRLLGF